MVICNCQLLVDGCKYSDEIDKLRFPRFTFSMIEYLYKGYCLLTRCVECVEFDQGLMI